MKPRALTPAAEAEAAGAELLEQLGREVRAHRLATAAIMRTVARLVAAERLNAVLRRRGKLAA